MNFGGRTDLRTSTRIIHLALDAGVTLVDTADVYSHDPADFSTGRGRSEEIVGRALRGRRDRRAERELLPMARTYGLAVLPWSPTAGGFLTGGYRRGEAPPPGSRFAEFWDGETARRHLAEPAFTVAETVATIAAARGATPAQIAVAWCLRQPGVTAPIVGPRTVEQLTDVLGALDVYLGPEELAALDAAAPPGRATVPYYGYDGMAWVPWGPHEHRW
ncbi:hypothetical protein GCM10009557_39860 [Virgisporangium ochraceum]